MTTPAEASTPSVPVQPLRAKPASTAGGEARKLFRAEHIRTIEANLPPYYDFFEHGGPYID